MRERIDRKPEGENPVPESSAGRSDGGRRPESDVLNDRPTVSGVSAGEDMPGGGETRRENPSGADAAGREETRQEPIPGGEVQTERAAGDARATDTSEGAPAGPTAGDAAEPRPAKSRFPTFGDLLAMLGIAFAAQILVGVVGRLVLWGAGAQPQSPALLGKMMALFYFVSMALTLGGVLYYRHVRGGRGRWARFSLRGLNPTLLLWSFVLIFAVGVVLEPLLRVLPELTLDVGRGFWTMLSLIVLAPLFEELLCRGVVLGSLRERYGVAIAWLVSALFFGVLHVQPVQVVNATIVGLILGYVYLSTDSLWSSMILHALNNAVAYLALVTGHANALLSDLVPNRTLYVVIYIVALTLSIVSGWMMVRTLRRMKMSEKKEAGV